VDDRCGDRASTVEVDADCELSEQTSGSDISMSRAAELEPGEPFVGRYEVQQLLGEGDRKRTYLARDKKMDRLVAISMVKPEAVLADPEGTEREAKVLGRIGSHPNIVSLYEYELDRDGSVEYMIFEYLGGGTLTAYLQAAGPQSLDDILRLGRQLCRGLSHLHKHGLVHRDVSPDNIWLDERNVAHLGDFDSAVPVPVPGADVLRPITTGSFAAPEEHAGRPLDVRSDLFSLGGVLYVAATGQRRPGDSGLLRSQRPDLPSAFSDLVTSLLAESPDDRPHDAEDVLLELDEIRHASNIGALIEAGENDKAEFKSSLHHPYGPVPPELQNLQPGQIKKEIKKALSKSVTKTIAAFLNADGGTLLIGVADSGAVLGIEPDYEHLRQGKQDADGWLLSLQEVIINALGADVWNAVHVSLVRHGSQTVAVVHCPARTTETWHTEDGSERFYIRAANGTRELGGSSILKYIRERWPS
jgi:serine/threonine protein kinase